MLETKCQVSDMIYGLRFVAQNSGLCASPCMQVRINFLYLSEMQCFAEHTLQLLCPPLLSHTRSHAALPRAKPFMFQTLRGQQYCCIVLSKKPCLIGNTYNIFAHYLYLWTVCVCVACSMGGGGSIGGAAGPQGRRGTWRLTAGVCPNARERLGAGSVRGVGRPLNSSALQSTGRGTCAWGWGAQAEGGTSPPEGAAAEQRALLRDEPHLRRAGARCSGLRTCSALDCPMD
jgi:hypothetical protein